MHNNFTSAMANTIELTTVSYDTDNSSRLSSPMSRSPTPPSELNYPSPASSQLSSLGSTPSPDDSILSAPQSTTGDDNSPPAKRRKLNEPKQHKTEYLDLSSGHASEDQNVQLERLLKVIHKKRKIVVIAGAGISVSAGIPDFRSQTGLFKTLKSEHNLKSSGKDLFDAAVYKDGNSTTSFHTMVRNLATTTKSAAATPFHHMLAALAQEGRLLRLYTQNVDGIDTSLPPLATKIPLERKGPWPKTVQLHGSLEKMVCTKCHQTSDLNPELFDGPVPPTCPTCEESDGVRTQHAGKRSHGIGRLRPRMVLYNEHNPDDEAIGSVVKADMRTRPDALIVVGTTLKVPGVKRIVREMSGIVRDRKDGGMAIWINNEPPPKDLEWSLIVRGPCDYVASHAAMRRWDDEHVEVSDEHVQNVKNKNGPVEVVVLSPSKNKNLGRLQGVLTPVPSPLLVPTNGKNTTMLAMMSKKQGKGAKPTSNAKPKKPAAPKKKPTAPKKKESKITIKMNFAVSKAGSGASQKDPKEKLQDNKLRSRSSKTEISNSDEITLQPVSPSAVRNNPNPPFQRPGSPRKPYTDEKGFPLSVVIPSPTTPSRESAEERNRIITPPGRIPEDLRSLLN